MENSGTKRGEEDRTSNEISSDLLVHIFSFLETNEILCVRCVCYAWMKSASHNFIWKSKLSPNLKESSYSEYTHSRVNILENFCKDFHTAQTWKRFAYLIERLEWCVYMLFIVILLIISGLYPVCNANSTIFHGIKLALLLPFWVDFFLKVVIIHCIPFILYSRNWSWRDSFLTENIFLPYYECILGCHISMSVILLLMIPTMVISGYTHTIFFTILFWVNLIYGVFSLILLVGYLSKYCSAEHVVRITPVTSYMYVIQCLISTFLYLSIDESGDFQLTKYHLWTTTILLFVLFVPICCVIISTYEATVMQVSFEMCALDWLVSLFLFSCLYHLYSWNENVVWFWIGYSFIFLSCCFSIPFVFRCRSWFDFKKSDFTELPIFFNTLGHSTSMEGKCGMEDVCHILCCIFSPLICPVVLLWTLDHGRTGSFSEILKQYIRD